MIPAVQLEDWRCRNVERVKWDFREAGEANDTRFCDAPGAVRAVQSDRDDALLTSEPFA